MNAAKQRIPYWDNARWIAMALVVIGHTVQPLAGASDSALVTYLVIYAFHMPLFGVISGYFATDTPTFRHYGKVITELIVPYLIFEFIWSIIRSLQAGAFTFDPARASWTLWFLIALAAFRLLLPMLARLRYPLLWAVAVAALVGYWDSVDQTFSAMRMLGMLPFFMLGWYAKRHGWMDAWLSEDRPSARRTLAIRGGAIAVFAAAIVVAWVWIDLWRETKLRHWFFLDRGYGQIGEEQPTDVLIRLALMAATTLLIVAALALVPRGAVFFSRWGRATMFIYLLHTFVLYWPRESDFIRDLAGQWWSLPAAMLAGFGLTMLLSTTLVQRLTGWLVEPKAQWLLRQEPKRDSKA